MQELEKSYCKLSNNNSSFRRIQFRCASRLAARITKQVLLPLISSQYSTPSDQSIGHCTRKTSNLAASNEKGSRGGRPGSSTSGSSGTRLFHSNWAGRDFYRQFNEVLDRRDRARYEAIRTANVNVVDQQENLRTLDANIVALTAKINRLVDTMEEKFPFLFNNAPRNDSAPVDSVNDPQKPLRPAQPVELRRTTDEPRAVPNIAGQASQAAHSTRSIASPSQPPVPLSTRPVITSCQHPSVVSQPVTSSSQAPHIARCSTHFTPLSQNTAESSSFPVPTSSQASGYKSLMPSTTASPRAVLPESSQSLHSVRLSMPPPIIPRLQVNVSPGEKSAPSQDLEHAEWSKTMSTLSSIVKSLAQRPRANAVPQSSCSLFSTRHKQCSVTPMDQQVPSRLPSTVSTPKRRSLVVFGRPRSLQVDRKEEDAKEVQEICGEKNAEEMTKEYAAEEGENSVHSPTGEEKREDVMEWSHSLTGEERREEIVAEGEVTECLHSVTGKKRRVEVATREEVACGEVMERLRSEQTAVEAPTSGSVGCFRSVTGEKTARCESVERSHSAGRKGKVLSNVRNIYSSAEVFGAFCALKSGYLLVPNTREIWSRLVDMLPAYKPNRCNHRLRTPEIDWGRVAYRCMSLMTYRYL